MRRSTLALLLLCGAVVLPVLLLEGRSPLAIGLTGLIAAAAAVAAPVPVRPRSSAFVAIGVGIGWTLLQLVPVPVSDAAMLDAHVEGVTAPTWWPVNLEPVAGAVEVAKLFVLACVYLATAAALRRGHAEWVQRIVIGSAAVAGGLTFVHVVLDAEHVYGIVQHEHVRSRLPGPFANENHLAALLGAVLPLTILQAWRAEELRARASWASLAAVLVFLVLATSSRSGIVGTLAGVAAFGLLRLTARAGPAGRPQPAWGGLLVSIALVTAGASALWLAWRPEPEDWEIGVEEKLDLGLRSMDLIATAPWTGVGRGAFSVAFVRFEGTLRRFTHPENFLLQWSAEWGIPVAAVVLGLVVAGVLRDSRLRESRTQCAALAGLVSLGIHDLADYATEVLAVSGAAAVLLAVVCEDRGTGKAPAGARRGWIIPGIGVVASLACFALSPVESGAQERRAEDLLRRAQPESALETALEGMRWHPREPAFPLLAASAADTLDDGRTLALLNRAMVLAPAWHGPHLEAARVLRKAGALGQAWVELRVADELAPGSAQAAGCGLLNATLDPQPLIRTFRGRRRAEHVLDSLSGCGVPEEVSLVLDGELAGSSRLGPRLRGASRATRAGEPHRALAMLEGVDAGANARVPLVRGLAHAAAGNPDGARVALASASRLARGDPRLLDEVARAQSSIRDAAGVRSTIDELIATTGGSTDRLSHAYLLLGELEARMGNQEDAMDAFEQAHAIRPSPEALERIASLAERRGETLRAYRAMREWCRLAPSGRGCEGARRLSGGD